jgi:adenosyl cobinamide kinase/adenosyl cobinamide phosphate guanylyltransferase/NaMN:DMB phosphoribosyltransferase
MSDDRWNTVLVLGGIRSGKSAFAESLVAGAPSVRYVATAADGEGDPEWQARIEAHRRRRPESWTTEETRSDPGRLAALLAEAKPDDTLLVDDLGGWVSAVLDFATRPGDHEAEVRALAAAVRGCAARVVLVSPEVGLTLVPANQVGRIFADVLGTVNQAVAKACDRVTLVVAGQPVWLKGPAGPKDPAGLTGTDIPDLSGITDDAVTAAEPQLVAPPAASTTAATSTTTAAPTVVDEPTMLLPTVGGIGIETGMELPLPDGDAGPDARDRLIDVDFAGAGLGLLVEAVEFAAATQATTIPLPWASVRVLLVSGSHAGGAAAGADLADAERRVAEVERGEGVLSRLAGEAGADIAVLRVAPSGAIEEGPVLDEASVETALRQGWRMAEAAADAGRDLVVLASIGVGTDAVAAAVSAAVTGSEPVAVLPRVLTPGGRYDDEAWMVRCAAVRDALHRIREEPRGARDLLRELGGADLAVATGALLGAASRRLPVLLDGPVGIAAALIARDLASQVRHWCLLPDTGDLALVEQGADVLGLTPVVELGLGLGEGANALAALPLLCTAIGLAAAAPVHPALLADQNTAALADPSTVTAPSDTALSDNTAFATAPSDYSPSDNAPSDYSSSDTAPSDYTAFDTAPSDYTAFDTAPSDSGSSGSGLTALTAPTELIVPNDEDVDLAEPEPDGPGPATTQATTQATTDWNAPTTYNETPAAGGPGAAGRPGTGGGTAPAGGGPSSIVE